MIFMGGAEGQQNFSSLIILLLVVGDLEIIDVAGVCVRVEVNQSDTSPLVMQLLIFPPPRQAVLCR